MIYKLFPILFLVFTTTSCAGITAEETTVAVAINATVTAVKDSAATGNEVVVCSEPRPRICTYDYKPVCASRDTGIRCVTTPCPSTENITYSNGCAACSDKRVISYQPGSCEAP